MYPTDAPSRLPQLTVSRQLGRQLGLDAGKPCTYSLSDLPKAMTSKSMGGTEMPASLYDISVANYIQTVTAVAGVLDKGSAHCTSKSIDPGEFVEAKLFADMLPLRFQVVSVAHHSLGAVEALKKGVFAPPGQTAPLDYRGLQKLIADTAEGLRRIRPEEINTLQGRDVTFQMRDRQIPFTAENFVLSFSLPNFYFHATTAYDILRARGVPLGKRDFLGQLRLKS
jgi:hypothetical protein